MTRDARIPRGLFRRAYGASPAHLLLVLGVLGLALYTAPRLLGGDTVGVALWFLGGALVHDLVLLPGYTLADRAVLGIGRRFARFRRDGAGTAGAGWVNAVRVPAFLAGLLLLVWFPLILRRVDHYGEATGLSGDVYLWRWLVAVAVLAAVSGVWLAVALWRARREARRR
ncbi:hypothetical protein FHX37_3393 [Haloactinospora alba]|uniref:Uncharacterized protein n=1 Tax=Haloactinospora alba TaxID=405555 RepID=A0A543NNH1_9ACTN|nr:hypothetical protein [Haloactinospora alba]TQN33378.1 hypothetical protein FHX37_3393 [Haloactinospora alba]